jgi:hypothetical protein
MAECLEYVAMANVPEVPASLTVQMTRDTAGVITSVDEGIVDMLG